jgi:hypothetical protein
MTSWRMALGKEITGKIIFFPNKSMPSAGTRQRNFFFQKIFAECR